MEFELLYMAWEPESGNPVCNSEELVRDLHLDILLEAMSDKDDAIRDSCKSVMTRPLTGIGAIRARSAVVRDALAHGDAFFELFGIAGEALEKIRSYLEFVNPKYDRVIPNKKKIVTETEISKLCLKSLRSLIAVLKSHAGEFSSAAMRDLCGFADERFPEDMLSRVEARVAQLETLKSAEGLSIDGHIGEGLKQTDILLDSIYEPVRRGKRRYDAGEVPITLSSMALIRNAEEVVESALAPVHKVIADFNRSIQRFFEKLRFQLGFFAGCINLRRKLGALHVPMCEPEISLENPRYAAEALADAGLALKERRLPTTNDFLFTGKRRVVITGPNQGGKTTFLRGVGLAQVMAQCGMFVTARSFACPLFGGIFTHFPNAEDEGLRMGLLEVELRKLREITDALKSGGLLLMNESFQTTMPLDAKRLADEIVSALADAGVTVLFVTHLYAYAMGLYRQRRDDTLFLRAERGTDGENTYKIQEGEPYKSAFGMDLFHEIIR